MRRYFLTDFDCEQLIDLSDLTLAARKFPLSFLFSTVSKFAKLQALSSSLPSITM